jgi:hypothetical protein
MENTPVSVSESRQIRPGRHQINPIVTELESILQLSLPSIEQMDTVRYSIAPIPKYLLTTGS